MLPLEETGRREKAARIMLLGGKGSDLPVQRFFDAMESKMRSLLHDHLTPWCQPTKWNPPPRHCVSSPTVSHSPPRNTPRTGRRPGSSPFSITS